VKIAITGASGYLGQQLVPKLRAAGATLLLVGRSPESLRSLFPECEASSYDELMRAGEGCEALVHLAVLNNDKDATYEEFERVNVKLAVDTCRQATELGIKRFVYLSSSHALDDNNTSFYATSKRAAAAALNRMSGIDIRLLYLPAIVGEPLAGRLSVLNRLPRVIRIPALKVVGTLWPTAIVDQVSKSILALSAGTVQVNSPLVVSDGQRNNLVFNAIKRSVDLAFAVTILILLWWAMIIIWAAIRLQSPGPGIFRQQRVGRNEQIFTCYKFRTMFVATPNLGTHQVSASAVTPLGKFMRRTKLDELPQIFNILFDQMSLVGPRPCLPTQVELIAERRTRKVFDSKPGITGLGQINGVDMSDPVRLANWDRRYLDLQSLLLDLRIILATARGKGGGDNTNRSQ
tara:strand:+ start:22714 stop:23925 length:1212 start_codon:yes stop_codon:yes gene_type:complete